MKTFEDFGVAVGDAPQPPVNGDAAEEAVTAYTNLGLITDEGKAREAFGEAVATFAATLPESVTSQPYDIVMAPKLGQLTLGGLIDRYDRLTTQKGNPETFVWSDLWDKYSAEEFNQGQSADIEPRAVLLGGENNYDEAGLYFINQNLKQQRKSLEKSQKDYESDDTQLGSMSVATYMVRNAMLLERSDPLMDQSTYTRFSELDEKRAGGFSCVPIAYSFDGGQVGLYRSGVYAYLRGGVRLSVR